MRIVCVCDAFRVGGRETYIGTYLRALRDRGVRATLLASSIERANPELRVFEELVEGPGRIGAPGAVARWLEAGRRAVAESADLLWVHHFDVHLGWLLSRLHGVPLLVTFHGPLFGVGRPNSATQALGIALGVLTAEGVSAVSPEVALDVERFASERRVALIPNVVEPPTPTPPELASLPTLVVATRTEKLGHLRRALEVFAACRRRGLADQLQIVLPAGETPRPAASSRNAGPDLRRVAKVFGRKWLLAAGPSVLSSVPSVRFPEAQFSVAELVARATAVLGMGRSLLEGAAAGRPCVLIGYEDVHGLLIKERFDDFARSNFSGRGNRIVTPDAAASELATLLVDGREGSAFAVKARSASEWAPRTFDELAKVAGHTVPPEQSRLAERLILSHAEGTGSDDESGLVEAVLDWGGVRMGDVFRAALAG